MLIQGLAGEGEQTWTEASTELVLDLHAVVAAVEGLRQICERAIYSRVHLSTSCTTYVVILYHPFLLTGQQIHCR